MILRQVCFSVWGRWQKGQSGSVSWSLSDPSSIISSPRLYRKSGVLVWVCLRNDERWISVTWVKIIKLKTKNKSTIGAELPSWSEAFPSRHWEIDVKGISFEQRKKLGTKNYVLALSVRKILQDCQAVFFCQSVHDTRHTEFVVFVSQSDWHNGV